MYRVAQKNLHISVRLITSSNIDQF